MWQEEGAEERKKMYEPDDRYRRNSKATRTVVLPEYWIGDASRAS